MSGAADKLDDETDAFSDVRLAESGEYLHEYTGVLAETGDRVRILALVPALAEIDAPVDAFDQVSDRWYNASANANILTIRNRGTDPFPWIAVPDHGGETLATLQPDLSPSAIETVVSETADALRTLGLYNTVHGHLSPEEIYLPDASEQTEAPSVHVGGFGLEAAIQTAVGEFEPTAFTAPEHLANPGQSLEHTDVYGLAAVTFFALTGRPPTKDADLEQAIRDGPSTPPSAYDDSIPTELDDVVMKALSIQPEDRYDSPYTLSRAFLSTFAPGDFRPDHTGEASNGEAEATESPGSTEATTDEDDDSESEEDDGSTESDDTDETNITRRAAVGLLGIGALGGAGWYLSRGQLTGPDPTEETADSDPPAEPSASISVTPVDPSVGDEVTFSATESTTGEGVSLETYEWAVGADTAFAEGEPTRTHLFSESGNKTVRLRITDSRDRTTTVTTTVTVDQPPRPPSASISSTQTNPSVNEDVTFSAAESTSGAGVSLETYEWAIGTDAEFSAGEETLITSFDESRQYTIRLRITDSRDRTATATTNVIAGPLTGGAPMFQYNAANTGSSPDETGPQSSISEEWTFQTGAPVWSSPAVVNGTVYVESRDNVYALSAYDGTEQWSFQAGGRSSPAVVDDTVYVNGQYNVYALSADDGTEQWSFQAGGRSSPVVVDGTVYIGSGYDDNSVYALSADDGTEQWSFQTENRVYSSPAVVDGTVYVGSWDSNVYALSADDGTEQWSFQTENRVEVDSSPAVADGTVYIGRDGGILNDNVYALSADDGTEQWSFQAGATVESSPAVVDDTVYMGSGGGDVYALSADNGAERWSFQTENRVDSSPAVVDDTVYVGSNDENVYALSADNGAEQWSFQTGDRVNSSPAVVDGTVYVGNDNGNVYALSE